MNIDAEWAALEELARKPRGKLAPFAGLIIEMWAAGAGDVAIADELMERGVDVTPTAIGLWRKRRDLAANPKAGKPRALNPSQHARALKQRDGGMPVIEMADYWNVTRVTIWKYLHRYAA